MWNVTVYLFLLENLPGFEDILTSSLSNLTNKRLSQCDPINSKIIWQHHINKSSTLKSLTNKYVNNNEYTISNGKYEDKTKLKYSRNNKKDNEFNNNNKYPERPPFLVAIFESFFNITAQTCSGCLISSQFVLTASSCLDLLSYSIKNSTDKQKSSYTIIANANNPLIDGTVHNVTQVILNTSHRKFQTGMPHLALMKIEPAVKIKYLQIFQSKTKYGLRARVYGWTVTKDLSGRDIMKAVSFDAKVVNKKKCNIPKYLYENHIICLMAESKIYVQEVNSGGPVLLYHGDTVKLLSVAEIRGSYIFAYTLNAFYNWIYDTIH